MSRTYDTLCPDCDKPKCNGYAKRCWDCNVAERRARVTRICAYGPCSSPFRAATRRQKCCSATCRDMQRLAVAVVRQSAPCGMYCGQLVGPEGAKGLCRSCYNRTAYEDFRANPPPCEVTGCPKMAVQPGSKLCGMHRNRLVKSGSVGPANSYTKARGTWSINRDGYVTKVVGRRTVWQHRVVMADLLGRDLLPTEEVHHKNGIRDDNRPENLELWTRSQPAGQRVDDLVAWIVDTYPDRVMEALAQRAADLASVE